MLRPTVLLCVIACVAASCSSGEPELTGYENPERAVVSWFEAIDAGDTAQATRAVDEDTLAIILSIENDLDDATTARFLTEGIPLGTQASYWASFADGFNEFASRTISTITVGEAKEFEAEGMTFARVPISGGPSAQSVVYARMREDGTWQVDMIATLADGFASLLSSNFGRLSNTEDGAVIAGAYTTVVAPGLWAAVSDGQFGDDFNRVALALLGDIEG